MPSYIRGHSNFAHKGTLLNYNPATDADLNMWLTSRSELSLVDEKGNNAAILTPVLLSSNSNSHFVYGDKTRVQEHLFDGNSYTLYLKFLPTTTNARIFIFGGATANAKRGIEIRKISDSRIDINCSDGITAKAGNVHSSLTLTGWIEIMVQIDFATKAVNSTVIHAGGTSTATQSIAAYTFTTNDNDVEFGSVYVPYAIANVKKLSAITTIANCRLDTYVTNLQLWYPDVVSGTDVSGNNCHFVLAAITKADNYYYSGHEYLLKNGYSVYKCAGLDDRYVPYDINGLPVTRTFTNFVKYKDYPGNATKHNLADSKIVFVANFFDRSNATIYTDEARLNFYDSGNVKVWHISELNRLILNDYLQTDYKYMLFPKCSANSYNDRSTLDEVLSYDTNKSGNDLERILKYTGDSLVNSYLYLKTPYTQVPVITASEDAEFTLKINDRIYYSDSELKVKTDKIRKVNTDEDFISFMFRWLMSNSAFFETNQLLSTYQADFVITGETQKYLRHPFLFLNSYSGGRCSELTQFAYGIIKNYAIENASAWKLGGVGHMVNNNVDAYIDLLYGMLFYKGKYDLANVSELEADSYLWTEPLRIYDYMYRARAGTGWTKAYYDQMLEGFAMANYIDMPEISALTMKLPATASLTLPVKTANVPKTSGGVNLTSYSHAIVTVPTSILGVIDMPFMLLQITGTGKVVVNSVEYTLPTDAATLKSALQSYANFNHSFTVTENAATITAEYLISPRMMQLYKVNKLDLTSISGSVNISKSTTLIPVPISILSVETKDSETLWSLTQDEFKTSDSFHIQDTGEGGAEKRFVFFYKNGLRPSIKEIASGSTQSIIAGTAVVDTCFAAILTPKQDTFTDSLELIFTPVDESSTYYTVDGSTPDTTKTLYVAPFTISATTTVKWISIKADYANSHVNSRTLTKL